MRVFPYQENFFKACVWFIFGKWATTRIGSIGLASHVVTGWSLGGVRTPSWLLFESHDMFVSVFGLRPQVGRCTFWEALPWVWSPYVTPRRELLPLVAPSLLFLADQNKYLSGLPSFSLLKTKWQWSSQGHGHEGFYHTLLHLLFTLDN